MDGFVLHVVVYEALFAIAVGVLMVLIGIVKMIMRRR